MTGIEDKTRRQARIAAIVIAVAMCGWMLVNFLGGELNISPRYAFLADLAAMAAFVWAMIVLFGVWRKRQKGE